MSSNETTPEVAITAKRFNKLVGLLRELFQLDQPELDFGIYRIMHAKSAEVTQFLEHDLLPQVKEAFAAYQPADKAALQKELEQAIERAKSLGVDPDSTQKVQELKQRLADQSVDIDALEADVYDHLYRFFRRYYHEGDFISRRVYKEGVYAIPYEGEEVKLYWANYDQYYIKTAEYLRDYAFRLRPEDANNPMRVHFRLVDAEEGEHGNVKETNKRVFVLATEDFIALEDGPEGEELVIRFEYRPATLTDWPEGEREGKKKPPAQEDLLAFAEQRILSVDDPTLSEWIQALKQPHTKASGEQADYSRLMAHLKRYAARNTFDYFIHKDLGGFLRRELDFYIKNEVMRLDDIENETAPRVEQYLSKIKVIRKIAHKTIDFLAQLEDFQKKLWLKKKFVVETFWCVTIGTILEIEDEAERKALLAEIAANEKQREEWVRLFAIDELPNADGKGKASGSLFDSARPSYSEPLTVQFLEAHPTLVVDTRHFPPDFTNRLLDSFDNLDEATDGLLIHSENWQALNLLLEQYRERVKCIYIDPPFNTGKDGFSYKDGYQHSSWMSMVYDRLAILLPILRSDATFFSSISDHELARFRVIGDQLFGEENFMATIEWNATKTVTNTALISVAHIHNLVWAKDIGYYVRNRNHFRLPDPLEGFDNPDNDPRGPWKADPFQVGGVRPNQQYEITNPKTGKVYRPNPGCSWKNDYETFQRLLKEGRIVFGKTGEGGPLRKRYLFEAEERGRVSKTWWDDIETTADGTRLLQHIFGATVFTNPKPVSLLMRIAQLGTYEPDQIILDHFAGSGTTGHAVINLSREDGGRRKFILVEMADYFDTVLLPRIKKVTFTPEWKDGRPKRLATKEEAERSPRIVKVIRLESYEDTLNNLEIKRPGELESLFRQPEVQGPDGFREQYMLRYMLDVETRGSASLLNIRAFLDPTQYRLKVKRPGSDESRETHVDLIETFNWLIGLKVRHISAPRHFTASFKRAEDPDLPESAPRRLLLNGRLKEDPQGRWWFRTVEGETRDGRRVLVIWRNRPGGEKPEGVEQDNLVLDEWFTKQGYSSKDSEFDLIYVNGTNNLENLKTDNDIWKVRLIEEDFLRRMFGVEQA